MTSNPYLEPSLEDDIFAAMEGTWWFTRAQVAERVAYKLKDNWIHKTKNNAVIATALQRKDTDVGLLRREISDLQKEIVQLKAPKKPTKKPRARKLD